MSTHETPDTRRILITGASGSVGRRLVDVMARRLAEQARGADGPSLGFVLATDIRDVDPASRLPGIEYHTLDICGPDLTDVLQGHRIDTVVHLAAIVTPRPGDTREHQYAVDVDGTDNVVAACLAAGVTRFVYTSSGAAYGYHGDNAALLEEDAPLRGNDAFAYSSHKRIVEERLADVRREHPELAQVVLRVSTVLGPAVRNQITALFERPVVLGIAGVDSPFCFISEEDVAACLLHAVLGDNAGVYNLTGDGVMTLREIAHAMGRRYVALPEPLLHGALDLLHKAGVAATGGEQLLFLRYRPVLSNERLKRELGYVPRQTSREVFETYRQRRA